MRAKQQQQQQQQDMSSGVVGAKGVMTTGGVRTRATAAAAGGGGIGVDGKKKTTTGVMGAQQQQQQQAQVATGAAGAGGAGGGRPVMSRARSSQLPVKSTTSSGNVGATTAASKVVGGGGGKGTTAAAAATTGGRVLGEVTNNSRGQQASGAAGGAIKKPTTTTTTAAASSSSTSTLAAARRAASANATTSTATATGISRITKPTASSTARKQQVAIGGRTKSSTSTSTLPPAPPARGGIKRTLSTAEREDDAAVVGIKREIKHEVIVEEPSATAAIVGRDLKPLRDVVKKEEELELREAEPSSKRPRTSSPRHAEAAIAAAAAAAATVDDGAKTLMELEGEGEGEYEPEHDVDDEEKVDVAHSARQIHDVDVIDADDPAQVAEYVTDIFRYMLKLEKQTMPNPDYMSEQPEVDWNMRGILVDWIIEVHHKFRLLPETLFLAVNIVDRFLSRRIVSVSKFQLVGTACLFIAAKYEEVISPSASNFVHMTEGGYDDDELLRAERYVLTTLEFDLSYPNPIHFLRRVSKAESYDIQTRTVGKYLMEIACVDHTMLHIPPSLLGAASIWLARLILNRDEWNATLTHYSSYTEEEILPAAQLMLDYILTPGEAPHELFFKKYAAKKYMKASTYVQTWARQRWPDVAHGLVRGGNELRELVDARGPLAMDC